MTCPSPTAAAIAAQTTHPVDMDRPTVMPTGVASGPAPMPDALPPQSDGLPQRITRRSGKLRHANGVQRARYRAVHMILGRCGVGDA